MSPKIVILSASVLAMFSAGQVFADSIYDDVPQFGGPSSTAGTLKEDSKKADPYYRSEGLQKGLDGWFGAKSRMQEKHGLAYGINFSALYQAASDSPGEDDAAGGIVQIPVSWTLTGRDSGNTGTLVFKIEQRFRIGSGIVPQDLGFAVGAVAITGTQFSDVDDTMLTNLFWQQRFNGGRQSIAVGQVDATDWLDVYGLMNPQISFQNLSFSTSPTIASPNQGFGLAFGSMLGENYYLVAGFGDANADPTEPGDSFDSFFDDHEYFKHVEIGWTTSRDMIYLDNIHLTLWESDERVAAGVPEGSGGTFSWARFIDGRKMPFVRIGYSDGGGGALMERIVSTGVGIYRKSHDLYGVAVSWGRPSEDSFGQGLDDQWTAEGFYRLQFSPNFAITADLQLIVDPALNPDEDRIWVAGLRGRLTL